MGSRRTQLRDRKEAGSAVPSAEAGTHNPSTVRRASSAPDSQESALVSKPGTRASELARCALAGRSDRPTSAPLSASPSTTHPSTTADPAPGSPSITRIVIRGALVGQPREPEPRLSSGPGAGLEDNMRITPLKSVARVMAVAL